MKSIKKILIRAGILIFAIYFVYALITQQQLINTYAKEKEEYSNQITQAKEKNEELTEKKENLNSTNYIESTARDELDMVYPNDRIYIDASK